MISTFFEGTCDSIDDACPNWSCLKPPFYILNSVEHRLINTEHDDSE